MNLVRIQPSITQKEMASILGWNLASVKYYITKLKDKKYLTRQGSSQKGKWIILKNSIDTGKTGECMRPPQIETSTEKIRNLPMRIISA